MRSTTEITMHIEPSTVFAVRQLVKLGLPAEAYMVALLAINEVPLAMAYFALAKHKNHEFEHLQPVLDEMKPSIPQDLWNALPQIHTNNF